MPAGSPATTYTRAVMSKADWARRRTARAADAEDSSGNQLPSGHIVIFAVILGTGKRPAYVEQQHKTPPFRADILGILFDERGSWRAASWFCKLTIGATGAAYAPGLCART